jgi:hypothetical protein
LSLSKSGEAEAGAVRCDVAVAEAVGRAGGTWWGKGRRHEGSATVACEVESVFLRSFDWECLVGLQEFLEAGCS